MSSNFAQDNIKRKHIFKRKIVQKYKNAKSITIRIKANCKK